jgi:hypothetical protein
MSFQDAFPDRRGLLVNARRFKVGPYFYISRTDPRGQVNNLSGDPYPTNQQVGDWNNDTSDSAVF